MFEFVDEIKELKNIVTDFRYTNYGGKVVVIQGYKDVLFLDDTLVILKLKSGELSVNGTNLKIKDYTNNFVVLTGNILNIETLGVKWKIVLDYR